MGTYIVYACPVGEFSRQVESYFHRTRTECGTNAAHNYMPHCSLTGFFNDEMASVAGYLQALHRVWCDAIATCPQPAIEISKMTFRRDWHGVELYSDWVKELIADFIDKIDPHQKGEVLRSKDWLHLSLAYDFEPQQHEYLAEIAQEIIEPKAPLEWELRFYQRHFRHNGDKCEIYWTCHQCWHLY